MVLHVFICFGFKKDIWKYVGIMHRKRKFGMGLKSVFKIFLNVRVCCLCCSEAARAVGHWITGHKMLRENKLIKEL